MNTLPVLLASQSPQRQAILAELGIDYTTVVTDTQEVTLSSPQETVMENARLKLLAALENARPGQALVTADTVVWAGGKVLGKPGDAPHAREYLGILSGHDIQAYSGMAVALKGEPTAWLCADVASMHIRQLAPEEIEWYISTGEPLTRAGAIGISHYGEAFVTHVDGSYSCIAGLSKAGLLAVLSQSPSLAAAILPVPPPVTSIPTSVVIHKINLP